MKKSNDLYIWTNNYSSCVGSVVAASRADQLPSFMLGKGIMSIEKNKSLMPPPQQDHPPHIAV